VSDVKFYASQSSEGRKARERKKVLRTILLSLHSFPSFLPKLLSLVCMGARQQNLTY